MNALTELHRANLVIVFLLSLANLMQAQIGTVKSHQKISTTEGGFTGTLDNSDLFGNGIAALGDLDGDGVGDIAVGAPLDDDGGLSRGAVWILFMNSNGTVKGHTKISDTQGGFAGVLDDFDLLGITLSPLGDFDGDGVVDLAAAIELDDDGGTDRGALYLLFLNANGTVKSHQKISDTQGGFTGILNNNDRFGASIAPLGDFDGDGVDDLAVGAYLDDDGGTDRGAVWILFLNSDGTVKSHQKISDTEGGFTGTLSNADSFGVSVAHLGDLDADGVRDIAVGAHRDEDGGPAHGAVWILFLNADATVKSHQKINETSGGFTGPLSDFDFFGVDLIELNDFDGDGLSELVVSASTVDDGGVNRGALWILFLDSDGTVKSQQKISDTDGGFAGSLDDSDEFGTQVAMLGDLDGDGVGDLAVGAPLDDDGGTNRGAVWVLFLDGGVVADTDGDGLSDQDEVLFGTDPNDSDTDDDGLLDGTEVDIALGTGCPDPLNPDSDGDTLTDGAEVTLGTDPCNPDSDGDTLPDALDPTPTDPTITTGVLDALARAICLDIEQLDLLLFNAPNANANRGRRNSMANRCRNAANRIAQANFGSAAALLLSVLQHIDGVSLPPDWMDSSPQQDALAVNINLMLGVLPV